MKATGKFMSDARISTHLGHVGIIVTNLDASLKFYQTLGFKETWRGAHRTSETLSWINLQLPDSNDYIVPPFSTLIFDVEILNTKN